CPTLMPSCRSKADCVWCSVVGSARSVMSPRRWESRGRARRSGSTGGAAMVSSTCTTGP
ncbi:MAG: hypothetical protein AVDCRST_MAG19-3814, partial [uncultured Thermomicrobiales bacterium]